MSRRDLETLYKAQLFAARFGFITQDLFFRYFCRKGRSQSYFHWKALVDEGWFVHASRDTRVLYLSRKSRKLLGSSCIPSRALMYVDHDSHLGTFFLSMNRTGLVLRAWTEADLTRAPWDAFQVLGSDRLSKIPDLVLDLQTRQGSLRVAIEIEKTRKSRSRYSQIAMSYLDMNRIDLLLFGCESDSIVSEVKSAFRGDPHHLKPWQQYKKVKAAWEGILDESIFYEAQRVLEEAASLERTRNAKGERRIFLLSGLLNCGETGLPLVGQVGHSARGPIYRYYHYARKPENLKIVRPRLNADELEEKVINEFKIALNTQGYFEELENIIKTTAEVSSKDSKDEYERLKKALQDTVQRISIIWANQGRMQLSEAALKLASEELNRLAQEKQSLEAQISQIDLMAFNADSSRHQALFVENQMRQCLQGWAKATPSLRKRLLRRVIKSVVVTADELRLTFWTSLEEQREAFSNWSKYESGNAENVVSIRRYAPPNTDQNTATKSSGKVRIGRG